MNIKDQNLLIVAVLVMVLLLLILYDAYDKCRLGKYSNKGCPDHTQSFYSPNLSTPSKPPSTPYSFYPDPNYNDVDQFAAHKLNYDKAAYHYTQARSDNIRSNVAQTTARQARLNSMREGFDKDIYTNNGPGWDNPAEKSSKWDTPLNTLLSPCVNTCTDGCNGTHCTDLCKSQCTLQVR